jgi:hypothetical protein
MNLRASSLVAALCAAAFAFAAKGPPLAGVWNIAPSGRAESSGDLHFRVTHNNGSDPVDITVPVNMGAKEDSIARSIRNSLGSQLRRDLYRVELGEGVNVLVSDPRGQPNFSLELIDSDIDNLRIAVQSVTPAAAPTVPPQSAPAVPPPATVPPASGDAPGDVIPPPGSSTPLPGTDMGIPDNSTPPAPDTSPPATPPATPPPETPPPATPPPATPPSELPPKP